MKNKKKLGIILVVLFVIVLLVIAGVIFFIKRNGNPDTKNTLTNQNINVVKALNYENTKFLGKFGELYLIGNNSSMIFLNDKGEKVLEFNDLEPDYFNHTRIENTSLATFVKINDLYRIYDKDFKKIIESKEELFFLYDEFNNIAYYIKENDLYNLNNEIVYEDLFNGSRNTYYFELAGDYVLVSDDEKNQIINIKTKQKYNFSTFDTYDEYLLVFLSDINNNKRKGVYVIDKKNNRMEKYDYLEYRSYGEIVYNENETSKKLISGSQMIDYGELLEVEDYKFDYTVCEDGFKVHDKEGNLINDTCYNTYYVEQDEYILLSKFKGELNDFHYLANGKISEYAPVGKFYVDDNLKIYNDKEEELKNTCKANFKYYKDDMYICGDGQSVYLVDESLNKISDSYDDLSCTDNGCEIDKDDKKGLIIGNEVVLEPLYNNVIIDAGNLVIIDEIFGNKILILGEGETITKEEISKPIEPYTNVDVNSVIEKNELDDMSDIINENKEIFKKYAYLVEKNKQLGNYKKYVYDSFIVVAKNKEYLDESYFFPSLRDLYIIDKTNEINLKANGYYYDDFIKIEVFKNWDTVIYHELMHFIDFRLNRDDASIYYLYNNEYINSEEYMNLPEEEKYNATMLGGIIPNFLTEGGAEINAAMYLNNNIITTYTRQVNVYSILNYIYGSDFMNEVYFSKNGFVKLFQKFIEAGYSYEDYEKFMNYTDYYAENNTEKNIVEYYDMLIKLYEAEKNSTWYDDDVLSLLVKNGLGYYEAKSNYTSRFDEYNKIKFDFEKLNKDFEKKYGDKYYISVSPPSVLYNDTLYVTFMVNGQNQNNSISNKLMMFVAKYDFNSGELSDYKYFEEN